VSVDNLACNLAIYQKLKFKTMKTMNRILTVAVMMLFVFSASAQEGVKTKQDPVKKTEIKPVNGKKKISKKPIKKVVEKKQIKE
jgi:hypothetical protein